MTKNKLILLVQRLKKENINIDTINNLKSISDEDIELILSTDKSTFHKILNMYLNKRFQELPIETKKQVIDKELKSQNKIELKFEEYFNNVFGTNGVKEELLQIITQIKDEKIKEWTNKMLLSNELLSNSNAKDIILLISKLDNSNTIYWIYKAATNKVVLSTEYSYELISAMTKINSPTHAELVYSIISNEMLLKIYNNSIIDIIKIITNIENPEIAFIVKLTICNNNIINYKDRLALIDLLSKSTGVYQAEYTYKIITSKEIINSGLVISLAKLAIKIPNNKLIQLPEKYVNKIKGNNIGYNEGEPLFWVETNFWNFFEKNPEESIDLLINEKMPESINIDEQTNIKRMIRIKSKKGNR